MQTMNTTTDIFEPPDLIASMRLGVEHMFNALDREQQYLPYFHWILLPEGLGSTTPPWAEHQVGGDNPHVTGRFVKPGDTVLLNSPHRCEPFTFLADDPRPNLGEEAARWCVEREIKCVGFGDAVAIENNVPGSNVMHEELFPRDILMLEVIENLDDLNQKVFFY